MWEKGGVVGWVGVWWGVWVGGVEGGGEVRCMFQRLVRDSCTHSPALSDGSNAGTPCEWSTGAPSMWSVRVSVAMEVASRSVLTVLEMRAGP